MPEIPNRAAVDAKATKDLTDLFARQRARIEQFGGNVPQVEWNRQAGEIEFLLLLLMGGVYQLSGATFGGQYGLNDKGRINRQAGEWATVFSRGVAREAVANSLKRIAAIEAAAATGAGTATAARNAAASSTARTAAATGGVKQIGTLGAASTGAIPPDVLDKVYGAARAESIAVSEITRARVAGEKAIVEELEKGGAAVVAIWEIEDENACDRCKAVDGTDEHRWSLDFPGGPPAHPRCRCVISWRVTP